MKTVLATTLVMVTVACGAKPGSGAKSQDEADSRDRGMGHMGGDHQMGARKGEKHEMSAIPPQIAKFHDTLAPRWHAAHGPQRMADTCTAIPQFHADAEAIAAAPPPTTGDAAAWSTGGKKLTEAVVALETTCKSKDAAAFETAFERVHETFHGLMEAGGGHDEHGKDDKDEHADHH